MQRFHQLLFTVSLLALSWFAMMAVHETGHVLGALATGGGVQQVVLHPLTISRTDVSPNPNPAIVVWAGPLFGSLLPLAVFVCAPRSRILWRSIAGFFAGFCLIANGAYLAFGSMGRIGDCRELMRTGTPVWVLLLFGVVTIPLGLYLWHCLGTLPEFIDRPAMISPAMAYACAIVLISLLVVEIWFSGM